MRDGDHRLALHHFIEAFLDRHFDFRVKRTGGFVEQQDRGVLEHHPGDGNALALAARQLDTALTHQRVVATVALLVTQLADEPIGLCTGCGAADLLISRVGASVGDVVANGAVQQRGVLRDHADGTAQAVLSDVRNVLPINAD